MSRNLDSISRRKRSIHANLLLEISLVLNLVSIVTYGVSGIELNSDEQNLELPLNVRRPLQLNHIYFLNPNDDSFSIEQRSSRFFDENPQLFVNPKNDLFENAIDLEDETPEGEDVSAGGDSILSKKDLIPRLYKKNERHEIPRVYKRSGIPRLYKKGGKDENLNTYQMYRRDSMPRLYKKSTGAMRDETFDADEIPLLRPTRSGSFPRLYKKRSPGGIPRLYKKAESMRINRDMTPRLYKKSSFMKKMLPRLYKRNGNEVVPRMY